jgi:hypothetical protein
VRHYYKVLIYFYIFSVAGGIIAGYLIIKNITGSGRGQILARIGRKMS